MRKAYQSLAHLISLGVVLEAAFVAAAWFAVLKNADDKKVFRGEGDFNLGHDLHAAIGMGVIPLLGVALLVVALLTRLPGAARWAGYTLVAIVVQVVLAMLGPTVPAIGALHGVNAFVILALAELSARRVAGAPVAEPVPPTS